MLDQTRSHSIANVVVFTGGMPKLQITLSEVLIPSLVLSILCTKHIICEVLREAYSW